ncbi:MAG TPA: acetyl-CoA acetyltransferase [Acidimicrobiia bacterium]|nr:acetyl-CoA acetyltransferase [Acidimicrobiia bacterium]
MSAGGGAAPFLGSTAIAGIGMTELSHASGRTVLSQAVEAGRRALEDCGLAAADVDGVVSFSLFNDSVAGQAVATGLGLGELTYALDLNLGGQAPCFAVMHAAMAVQSGLARAVLVYRALNGRSGTRVGSTRFAAPTGQYRYPVGLTAYPQYIALWIRRFLIETGGTDEDLAAVVAVQRDHAAKNDRAVRRAPLDLAGYRAAPMVVEPLRTVDCTVEVDGACAVIVTSLARARDLATPPAVLRGAAWSTPAGSGLDIADLHSFADWTRNCQAHLAPRLWGSAGIGPADVDVAEIYDCFSGVVLMGLEGLGLAGRGEAGAFVRSGATASGGRLPTNTHGGLLCEGYLHGMNTVAEAARQVQLRGGAGQVPGAETCVVTSGALMDGSALVLAADR